MVISTRVSIQWPPEEAEELSHTMAFTSPQGHYVDIRILKTHYPYVQHKNQPFFDEVFQWCLCGTEQPIEGTNKIRFINEIDSQAIAKSVRSGKYVAPGEDIGDFSAIEGSHDRKEVGSMVNPATGRVQDYIEIWRSLDPLRSTPTEEVREPAESEPESITGFSLEIKDNSRYLGKLIRLGFWIQGIVYDKQSENIHVIRSHFNLAVAEWQNQIEYGQIDQFPLTFAGEVGDKVLVSSSFSWSCVEREK